MKHYVYAYRDASNALLYVGETNDWARRAREHMRDKPWADEVASVEITHFPSQREAQVEEVRRIRSECPRHNLKHNNGSPRSMAQGPPNGTVISEVDALRNNVKLLREQNDWLLNLVDAWANDYQYMKAERDKALNARPRVFVCEPASRALDPRVPANAGDRSPQGYLRRRWPRMRAFA